MVFSDPTYFPSIRNRPTEAKMAHLSLSSRLPGLESVESLTNGDPKEGSYTRLQRLSNMDSQEAREHLDRVPASRLSNMPSLSPLFCVILFSVLYLVPLFPEHPSAHSTFAVLIVAAVCWGIECIPSYATGYFALAACVWLRVGLDDSGNRMGTRLLAIQLAKCFMDPIILVFLGFLAISAALAKLQITDRVTSWCLSKIPPRPALLLLVIMLLNYVMAAFLSNIASTTLTLTFALRIIRSLDPDDSYIRAILFGLAWSGNAGGMATPIASPQNILAVNCIKSGGHTVSFLRWWLFAIPTSLLLLFLYWGYLTVFFLKLKRASDELPRVVPDFELDDSFIYRDQMRKEVNGKNA
jgi:phosphate transporter